jgi:transketolase
VALNFECTIVLFLMNYRYKQKSLRKKLLSLYFQAKVGHIGSALSCLDLLIVLFDQKKENELILLSKGHAAGALYIVLNDRGELTDQTLDTFCQNGTLLSAHPAPYCSQSIPFSSGSLGHGLPIGCGIALANQLNHRSDFTYVLMSDGETNEGSVWEAAHFAVSQKLDHLIAVIDKNRLQAFGETSEVLGDTSAAEKWESIGFDIVELDGHDAQQIADQIEQLKYQKNGKPKLIIANTVKGKGVSFMENIMEWHYLAMSAEQFQHAMTSLDSNYDA